LDAETAHQAMVLLDRLNRETGKTMILVTHDPKAAAAARRLVRLEKGVLVSDDQSDGLVTAAAGGEAW
jgi:putative ABC transport system ATP-binding protein